MSQKSGIEWTDATWNPVSGCTKVSAGCAHCYAETLANRFWKDRKFTDVQCHPERLDQPLKWRKPKRIFVNSMSDLFHENVPDEFIADVFNVMASRTPECGKRHEHEDECWTGEPHTFQILTKRPERMRKFLTEGIADVMEHWPGDTTLGYTMDAGGWPLKNVWLGVSVEDQKSADERIPILLQTPAAVRFISAEPLLGPVDLGGFLKPKWYTEDIPPPEGGIGFPEKMKGARLRPRLDWAIVGGESGHGARPCRMEWIESIIHQCDEASIPCFVKQLGSFPQFEFENNGVTQIAHGKYHGIKDKKGGDISEWPEDLRVRQFPNV